MRARRLFAFGLAAFIALSACTLHLPDERYKAHYIDSLQSRCMGRSFADRLGRFGANYCTCTANAYRAAFSPVEIALVSVSETVRAHARSISNHCGSVATMQGSYDDLMSAIGRKSTLAATAYFTPKFVSTDVQGHRRDANQMLAELYARADGATATTTVDSVQRSGRRVTVGRTTRESGQVTLHGRSHRSETATSFIDTWIDADGALLLDKSEERSTDSYIDGKLVSHVVARKATQKGDAAGESP
jgi:hypothetical protein